jgi:hypothetical protein
VKSEELFGHEDSDSMILQSVSMHLLIYTASQSRRKPSSGKLLDNRTCCKCSKEDSNHALFVGTLWRRIYICGGGRKSILLEGTQAMPTRPSDKDRIGVKTFGWRVAKAWDRDGRILFHESLLNVDIIWKLTNFVALEQGAILMKLLREGCMRSMQ